MNTFFNNSEAAKAAELLYENKLEELNIAYEYSSVETSFGQTNLIITGSKNNPPMFLIHGSNGCAPVAIEALRELTDHYRIYAVDVVGQPNKSEACRPNLKDNSYGEWVYEILSRLNLKDVTLVGISFGGFICWKTLVFDESRISKAFLIVPAGIVNGNPFKAIAKVFIPMKLYKRTKNEKYVRSFLNALFTEEDTFALKFLSIIFLHFEMDFSPIPTISAKDALKISTPINFIGSVNDIFFPGKKMMKRVKKIFPSLNQTMLLNNSKHVPSELDNQGISAFIKQH